MKARFGPGLSAPWLAIAAALMFLTACGGGPPKVSPGDSSPGGTDKPAEDDGTDLEDTRFDKYTVEGMKLRPGIKIVQFTKSELQDVQGEPDERTVTLTASAAEKAKAKELDKHDVLVGPGFAYQAASVTPGEATVDVELEQMSLVNIVYGEWEEEYTVTFKPKGADGGNDAQGDGEMTTKSGKLTDEKTVKLIDVEQSFKKPALLPVGAGVGGTWPVGNNQNGMNGNNNNNQQDDQQNTTGSNNVHASVSASIKEFEGNVKFELPLTAKVRWDGRIDRFRSEDNYQCENKQSVGPFDYCIDHFSVEFVLEPEAELDLKLRAKSAINVKAFHDFQLEERVQGVRIPLGQTGLAFRIAPILEAGIEAGITGEVGIESHMDGSAKFPVGVRYEDGQFETYTENESNFTHRWRFLPPAEAAMYGGFYVTPGIQGSIVPTVTDVFEVKGISLEAKIAPRMWYRLSTEVPYCVMWGVLFEPSVNAFLELEGEIGWKWAKIVKSWNISPGITWTPKCKPAPDDGPKAWCLLEPEGHGGGKFCPGGSADPSDGSDWQGGKADGSDNNPDGKDGNDVEPKDKDLGSVKIDKDKAFMFSAQWSERTDLNLHVKTPSGEVISPTTTRGPSGGRLLRDGCPTDGCSELKAPFVETIQWDKNAPSGTYEFWMVNKNGNKASDFDIHAINGVQRVKSADGNVVKQKGAPSNQRFILKVK